MSALAARRAKVRNAWRDLDAYGQLLRSGARLFMSGRYHRYALALTVHTTGKVEVRSNGTTLVASVDQIGGFSIAGHPAR